MTMRTSDRRSDPWYFARVTDDLVARARAAISRGDVLLAYDEATSAVEADPDHLEARFVAALALARSGAVERAGAAAAELLERLSSAADASVSLREDAAALVARLAKDEALATSGSDRLERLRRAADLYEAAARQFGRFFTCINAATLRLLAGDVERARQLARAASDLVATDRASGSTDDYWLEATAAEAALIVGDLDEVRRTLAIAAEIAGEDYAAVAVTRRQLRLVCEATGAEPDVLDVLAPPLVLHYSGHLIDERNGPGRFPPNLEGSVEHEIRAFVTAHHVGFAYGSLASGADILAAEALLEAGIRLEIVLPFDTDEFEQVSVAPAGAGWLERFRSCLARASSVVHASDSSFMHDDGMFGYAARIAMGHALNRAAFLDAPAAQLAIWDGDPTPGAAGTGHDIAMWRATGHPTHIISLPASPTRSHTTSTTRSATNREIGTIVFTDLHGFSRLRDEQFSTYVGKVLSALGAVIDEHSDAVRWVNTWGDAIAAVFSDVTAAADCALGFHEALARVDLEAIGLPPDLDLRIGAHAGPVMAIVDPVSHKPTYWGRELTRAARIEPRTPEGEVYVTDAFAALLALKPGSPFATEYVGRVTTAKDFETIPMYRLRRRSPRSARESS
jgi:tetratricopeptide (TPR) repeat protein